MKEFKELLPEFMDEMGHLTSSKIEVEETGSTFFENALLKAQGYFNIFKRPILSDDSGLCVEALPLELGVYSARFGGPNLTDHQRCEKLLEKLKGVENRNAYFVCVLCCYFNSQNYFFFEGRVSGQIGDFEDLNSLNSVDAFGYDPVFFPDKLTSGQSFSENLDWKMKNSHRASAVKEMLKFFNVNKNFTATAK